MAVPWLFVARFSDQAVGYKALKVKATIQRMDTKTHCVIDRVAEEQTLEIVDAALIHEIQDDWCQLVAVLRKQVDENSLGAWLMENNKTVNLCKP